MSLEWVEDLKNLTGNDLNADKKIDLEQVQRELCQRVDELDKDINSKIQERDALDTLAHSIGMMRLLNDIFGENK